MPVQTDMICAAGQEMRDYETLIEAMRGIDIRRHIAAGTIRLAGKMLTKHKESSEIVSLPPNVSVGRKTHTERRALYARSRFVVVPLFPSETGKGTVVILEAMAMGKAVICSRTEGQIGVIQEGKTGLFVPQGDPRALRAAIEYLWNNPVILTPITSEQFLSLNS